MSEQFRKLFIGGLSYDTTEDSLRGYFEKWGNIVDCVVMRDGNTKRSRGFGFVTYDSIESLNDAQANRPHVIDNKEVESKRATPREEAGKPEARMSIKKVFVGGLREEVDEDQLRDYFSSFGSVVSVDLIVNKETGRKRGFAFVSFDDYDPVDKICLEKEHMLGGKRVDIRKALDKKDMATGGGAMQGGRGGARGGARGGGRSFGGRGGYNQGSSYGNGGGYGGGGGGGGGYNNGNGYNGGGDSWNSGGQQQSWGNNQGGGGWDNSQGGGNWNQGGQQGNWGGNQGGGSWDNNQSSGGNWGNNQGYNNQSSYGGGQGGGYGGNSGASAGPVKGGSYSNRSSGPYGGGYGSGGGQGGYGGNQGGGYNRR